MFSFQGKCLQTFVKPDLHVHEDGTERKRVSSKSLQSGILRQDFPYSKLKCMRALISNDELTRVITKVIQR